MKITSIARTCLLLLSFLMVAPVQALDGGVESLRKTGKAFAAVARSVSPAVVFIQVEGKGPSSISRFSSPFGEQSPFENEFCERFFGERFPGMPRMPKHDTPPTANDGRSARAPVSSFPRRMACCPTRHTS